MVSFFVPNELVAYRTQTSEILRKFNLSGLVPLSTMAIAAEIRNVLGDSGFVNTTMNNKSSYIFSVNCKLKAAI
jgi:hypothetical protein